MQFLRAKPLVLILLAGSITAFAQRGEYKARHFSDSARDSLL